MEHLPGGVSGCCRRGGVPISVRGWLVEGAWLVVWVSHASNNRYMPRVPHAWSTQLTKANQCAREMAHASVLMQQTSCLCGEQPSINFIICVYGQA